MAAIAPCVILWSHLSGLISPDSSIFATDACISSLRRDHLQHYLYSQQPIALSQYSVGQDSSCAERRATTRGGSTLFLMHDILGNRTAAENFLLESSGAFVSEGTFLVLAGAMEKGRVQQPEFYHTFR